MSRHKFFYEKTAINLFSDLGQIHHRLGDMAVRDMVVSRGGYLGFRMDRAAHTMREAGESSQVANLLLEVVS